MLWHYDDGVLLALKNYIYAHFFLLILLLLPCWIVLNQFQQALERLVRTTQAPSLGACWPLKFVYEFDDLHLKWQDLSLNLFGQIALPLEATRWLISFVILHGKL